MTDEAICRRLVGAFRVSPELLADCLGVPEGYSITTARSAEDGSIEIVVLGNMNAFPGGKLQLVVEQERGQGLFGGVIRRTRFEAVDAATKLNT